MPPEKPNGTIAVEYRRDQVRSLLIRHGWSVRQIAAKLHTSKSAIDRDIQQIRPSIQKALPPQAAEDLYREAVEELDEARREMWRNYEKTPKRNLGMRLAYLNSIISLPERRVRLGQSLGLVVEAPKRIEFIEEAEQELADALMVLPEEDRERIRASMQRTVRR